MDTLASKEEKTKGGGSFDGHTTLRRTIPKHSNSILDSQKARRQHVDSGYSTCDGLDKRWSQEMPMPNENVAKWSPTPIHIKTDNYAIPSGQSTPSLSPGQTGNNGSAFDGSSAATDENRRAGTPCDLEQKKQFNNGSHSNNSTDESPDGDTPDSQKSDEKLKSLGNVQTYR